MTAAFVYDAVRTPRGIGKPGKGALSHLHPQHLAATVLAALKARNKLDTSTVDDIIWSTSTQEGKQGGDLGRMSALAAGYDINASGTTLDRFCGGGITSVNLAAASVMSGMEDCVIAGGTEAPMHPLPFAGFAAMKALSTRNDDPQAASRPYDVDRDGFVLGEGAGVMVIESEEHAKARGARVYAELAGTGVTSDSHHITAPEPEGLGATRAMRAALKAADLTPEDVCHVNAHATSTPKGDAPEYLAMRAVFGDHLDQVQVSATKSQTGHLLGASGAIESILSVLAVHHGQAPVTINLDHQDPEIPLNVVTGSPARLPEGPRVAVKNSFGFGGHNAVAVFRSV